MLTKYYSLNYKKNVIYFCNMYVTRLDGVGNDCGNENPHMIGSKILVRKKKMNKEK